MYCNLQNHRKIADILLSNKVNDFPTIEIKSTKVYILTCSVKATKTKLLLINIKNTRVTNCKILVFRRKGSDIVCSLNKIKIFS